MSKRYRHVKVFQPKYFCFSVIKKESMNDFSRFLFAIDYRKVPKFLDEETLL